MPFASLTSKNLFPTPFIMASFSPEEAARINGALIPFLIQKAAETPGTTVSNRGGWQSDTNLPEWGGEPIQTILAAIKDLLYQVTLRLDNKSFDRAHIDWKINGWANVNRKGNANVMHAHPGAYWSAVYYVQVDETPGPTGGELELFDPRGILPSMYCPLLRFGVQGAVTAGGSELHKPVAGQCVLFPSWLQHAVTAYNGDSTRISLAFNFSV